LDETRVAIKLTPDWLEARWRAVDVLTVNRKLDEAEKLLPSGEDQGANSWAGFLMRGMCEAANLNWDKAIDQFRRCTLAQPDFAPAHFLLGSALAKVGQYKASRDEFRLYLQGQTRPDLAATAREALAFINERLNDGL